MRDVRIAVWGEQDAFRVYTEKLDRLLQAAPGEQPAAPTPDEQFLRMWLFENAYWQLAEPPPHVVNKLIRHARTR